MIDETPPHDGARMRDGVRMQTAATHSSDWRPPDLATALAGFDDADLAARLQSRLDSRTKPRGSLGRLEALALQIGLLQGSAAPQLQAPRIAVFAGDHGAARAGVSAYPQEVTAQMVANFLRGGAAINVLARQYGLALCIVDAGVAHPIERPAVFASDRPIEFIDARIDAGTRNYLDLPAMSPPQCLDALARGEALAQAWAQAGCNAIGLGEMGIGNTASASLITAGLCAITLDRTVGRGTGLDDAGLARKRELLVRATRRRDPRGLAPLELLAEFGGFEIAMMAGAYLGAARARMLIVVDGFIATAALLIAHALAPEVLRACVFAHRSREPGHAAQLAHLRAEPLFDIGLCLGEGSGSALAFGVVHSALALYHEMAGFADAGVSTASAAKGGADA